MATTTFNIRMEEEVKERVDEIASLIGMPTATVFNVFARQFIAHRGFPFAVTAPAPTEREFAAEMERRYAEVKSGLGTAHELIEA